MSSKTYVILRSARRARLEGRKAVMQSSAISISQGLGREGLHLVRQGEQVHRAVADRHLAGVVEPGDGVLQPVLVVALRKIVARVGAAALGAVLGRMQRDDRLLQQVLQFERL